MPTTTTIPPAAGAVPRMPAAPPQPAQIEVCLKTACLKSYIKERVLTTNSCV